MFPINRFALVLLIMVGAATLAATAQDNESAYKPVRADELKQSMPRFWATGIAVEDTLTQLPGETEKIDGRTYRIFETRVLGTCMLDAGATLPPQGLEVGKPYIFTGTILQQGGGWFSGGIRYHLAASQVSASIPVGTNLVADLTKLGTTGNIADDDAMSLRNMQELLTGLQATVIAEARKRDVPLWQMYDAGGTNRAFVQNAVKIGVNDIVTQLKMTPETILARFVLALMAQQNPQPAEPVAAQPSIVPTNAPPVVMEKKKEEPAKKKDEPKPEKKKKKAPAPAEKKEEPVLRPRVRALPNDLPEVKMETKKVEAEPAANSMVTPEPEPAPAVMEVQPAQPEPAPELQPQPEPQPAPVQVEPPPPAETNAPAETISTNAPVETPAPVEKVDQPTTEAPAPDYNAPVPL